MNNKGFVLAEVLVVTIFVLIIFTLLYTSAVPLIGRYDELSYYDDLDTTYDVYQYKKIFESDSSFYNLINTNDYKKITCSDFSNSIKCDTLNDIIDFKDTDTLLYLKTSDETYKDDVGINSDIKDYLNYIELPEDSDILLLQHDGYISYVLLNSTGGTADPVVTIEYVSGDTYSDGYKNNLELRITCVSPINKITSFQVTVNNSNVATVDIGNDNESIKTLKLTTAGSNKKVKGVCTNEANLTDSKEQTYKIYVYSQDSSCSCKTYNYIYGARCICIQADGNSYYRSIGGYSSCPTNTTCNNSCKNHKNTNRGGSLDGQTGCISETNGCKVRNSCWHT